MIPFTIDTHSYDLSKALPKAFARELYTLWNDDAGIFYLSEIEKNKLRQIVETLPDNVRRRFTLLLDELPIHSSSSLVVSDEMNRAYLDRYQKSHPKINIIITSADYWDKTIKHPDDGENEIDRKRPLSVCRSGEVLYSDILRKIKNIKNAPIINRDKALEIWRTRFQDVLECESSKLIAIVDRYAFAHVADEDSFFQSGIYKFITNTLEIKIKKHITIYVASPSPNKDERDSMERNSLDYSEWQKRRVLNWERLLRQIPVPEKGSLTLVVVPDKEYGMVAHDRYIRAGRVCWEIGCGMEVFQDKRMHENISLNIRSNDEIVRKCDRVETKLNTYSKNEFGRRIVIYS